ncbi:aminotransferase class I/II-fold pyridoxal phosphate-dependent enzyme [Breoghania sp.]|uniref:aminotransferase class I/II-fold pyridoxal phosphate-dependent enzyme n=1 Tax=Breoghania sp. TaxID=2065378 RepID=UPI002AAB4FCC|nr:aminotransferase class I/II-fold pyridoxal phosphate-dependent enzyme [Breoghania sp.]
MNLPTAQAFDLLAALRSAGVYKVEDDVHADLVDEPATRLAALSGLKGLVYVRSFSKTISGGLRCGSVSAESGTIEAIAALTLDFSFGLNSLSSVAVFKRLKSGLYRRNLSAPRTSITRMRVDMTRNLRGTGFEGPIEPDGGIFVWARWTGQPMPRRLQMSRGKNKALCRSDRFSARQARLARAWASAAPS